MPRNKSESRQPKSDKTTRRTTTKANEARTKERKNERVKTGEGKGKREGEAHQYKLRVKSPKRDKCHCVLGAQSRTEQSAASGPGGCQIAAENITGYRGAQGQQGGGGRGVVREGAGDRHWRRLLANSQCDI